MIIIWLINSTHLLRSSSRNNFHPCTGFASPTAMWFSSASASSILNRFKMPLPIGCPVHVVPMLKFQLFSSVRKWTYAPTWKLSSISINRTWNRCWKKKPVPVLSKCMRVHTSNVQHWPTRISRSSSIQPFLRPFSSAMTALYHRSLQRRSYPTLNSIIKSRIENEHVVSHIQRKRGEDSSRTVLESERWFFFHCNRFLFHQKRIMYRYVFEYNVPFKAYCKENRMYIIVDGKCSFFTT